MLGPHKSGFSHTWGLSAHAHNIVQEAASCTILCKKLLSGIEELIDYYTLLLFLTLTNSKRFGARLTHRLNRKFVRTDDTTQDSEETFTVSQSSQNSREQSFSMLIHESTSKRMWLEAYRSCQFSLHCNR